MSILWRDGFTPVEPTSVRYRRGIILSRTLEDFPESGNSIRRKDSGGERWLCSRLGSGEEDKTVEICVGVNEVGTA